MSTLTTAPALPTGVDADGPAATDAEFARIRAGFLPLFERIAAGAAERDRTRTLPRAEIRELAAAGFGALRVPRALGGPGLDLVQVFRLLAELAAADSNIAQALRGHFAFIEDRLAGGSPRSRELWARRALAGELVGNAWTEIGAAVQGRPGTRLSVGGTGLLLNGEKFYSTGSIYADWIDVLAGEDGTEETVFLAVSTHQDGVENSDDWDGFGQRTTASGTARFRDAAVEPGEVIRAEERFGYQASFYQAFHLAALAGIARAATSEAAALLATRDRSYSHGNAARASADAQLLQVIGEASAQAYLLEALNERVAGTLRDAYLAQRSGDTERIRQTIDNTVLAASAAQVASIPAALRATGIVFDALGASAVREAAALDRHWRNARTVSSHNPWVYKARILGEYEVGGVLPDQHWRVGRPDGAAAAS